MLGFILNPLVDGAVASTVSTIISYDAGALHIDMTPIKGYVDAKVDTLLNRKVNTDA